MIIESKPLLELVKECTEISIPFLEAERDSLFDLPEDPEEKLKKVNTKITAASDLLDAINSELNTKH